MSDSPSEFKERSQPPSADTLNTGRRFGRGKILKGLGAVAAGVGMVGLYHEAVIRAHLPETLRDFSTGETDYRFLGGAHGSSEESEKSDLRRENIPNGTTIWQFETGANKYLSPRISDEDYGKAYHDIPNAFGFAREVTTELTAKGLPLVITDVPTPDLDPEFLELLGLSLVPGAGMWLLGRKEQSLTRRHLFFGGALAVLGGGLARYTAGNLVSLLHKASSAEWAQKAAQMNHYVELSKPESLNTTFRNAVIAGKNLGLENRYPKNQPGGKAGMLMVFGSGHWGLPEYVESGKQEVLDYLSLYPKPFIHAFFGENNPHLYTSVIITPDGNSFKIEKIVDPDLKKVFS